MKLLIAVDFSTTFHRVIEYAGRLGNRLNAKIWLLHVAAPNPELVGREVASKEVRNLAAKEFHDEHRKLQEAGDELRKTGLDCVALLIQGDTVETILAEAEKLDIDFIVLGPETKGTTKKLFLGSTCEDVVMKSTIPVIVVPPHLQ